LKANLAYFYIFISNLDKTRKFLLIHRLELASADSLFKFSLTRFSTASEWRVGIGFQEEDSAERFRGISTHHSSSLASWAVTVGDLSVVGAATSVESVAVDRFCVEQNRATVGARSGGISSTSWLGSSPVSLEENGLSIQG
jgi:hypothetical protein